MISALPSVLAAAACALCACSTSLAQQWPQRPVKVVVGYTPGGNTDAIARVTAERLSSGFGQRFLVENRGGASGAIGAELVAKAPADGYTLCVCTLSQLAPVPLTQKVPYDPLKDFAPIANIGANAFVITVGASVPVNSLKEFIEYARARPNALNYGSGGTGNITHLSGALFLSRAGAEMTHVPYKGGVRAIAVLSEQVQMYMAMKAEVLTHARSGKLKLLGVTGERRDPLLPDVPAVAELFPGFRAVTWNGLLATAGTPVPVIERIAQEMQKAMKDPSFLEQLARIGVDPVPGTTAEFAETIRSDHALWRGVIESGGILVE
jgi:tripartite-type tricarboxylate transporter receptor subunit TctC